MFIVLYFQIFKLLSGAFELGEEWSRLFNHINLLDKALLFLSTPVIRGQAPL